jgi:hypothetical protein
MTTGGIAMSAPIRVRATVLPGGKLEIISPALPVGQSVEVTITLPDTSRPAVPPQQGIYDFLQSLPPGPRSAESWEEIERQFQEERDSWDR